VRTTLLILCGMLVSCQAPPTTFVPVDYPSEPKVDWIQAGPAGVEAPAESWTPQQEQAFVGEMEPVTAIRAVASADDFHGSKLYDGFDLTVQPLDNDLRPVKRLGSLTVVLYDFHPDTLSGKAGELMRWHVPVSRMRTFWKMGPIDAAYRMKLAWTMRPTCDYVKMEVRFATVDAKVFTKLLTAGIDQPRYRWLAK